MRNIPMFKVAMNHNIDDSLLKVLHSGWIGQGDIVKDFEHELGRKFNNSRVLSLSSGTHGLSLALRLANIGPGDYVISTPLTCTATNMPILQAGAKIIWADVKDDFNIDPESVRRILNATKEGSVKAIMIVHWGGYPCDMLEFAKMSLDYGNNITIIEDCAHAYGSTYTDSYIDEYDDLVEKEHIVGDCWHSNFAMFSFQAIKHLTCVDGGCLCVSNDDDYDRGKLLRWYGIDRESPRTDFRCEEDIKEWGYKFHMNDVCATIGLKNMALANTNIHIARSNAMYYDDCFKDVNGITLTQTNEKKFSSYWLYTMMVEDRSEFTHMMGSKGISVSRVHERNDKHTCFQDAKDRSGILDNLEKVVSKMICIPIGWWVTKEDRSYIVDCIKGGW